MNKTLLMLAVATVMAGCASQPISSDQAKSVGGEHPRA